MYICARKHLIFYSACFSTEFYRSIPKTINQVLNLLEDHSIASSNLYLLSAFYEPFFSLRERFECFSRCELSTDKI